MIVTMIRRCLFMLQCFSSLYFDFRLLFTDDLHFYLLSKIIKSSHDVFSLLGAVYHLEAVSLLYLLYIDALLSIAAFS